MELYKTGKDYRVVMAEVVRVSGLNKLVRDLQKMKVDVADLKLAFGRLSAMGAKMAAETAPRRTGRTAGSARGSKAKNRATVSVGRASLPWVGRVNFQPGFSETGYHWMQRVDERLSPLAPALIEADIIRLIREKRLQP